MDLGSPSKPGAWQRIAVWSALAGLFAYLSWPLLPPLLLAAIFGIVLFPVAVWLQQRGLSSSQAAGIVVLVFTIGVLGPTAALLYWGGEAALERVASWQKGDVPSVGSVLEWASTSRLFEPVREWMPGGLAEMRSLIYRAFNALAKGVGQVLQSALIGVPVIAASALVLLFGLFYALAEGHRVPEFVRQVSRFSPRVTEEFLQIIYSSCRAGVLATMLTGLIQASVVALGCLIMNIDEALLLALLTFLLSFVPVLGTGPIGVGIPLYLLLARGPGPALLGALIFGVVVASIDNVVRPFLAKKDIIHPLPAVVLTLGGLFMMGPYGLFLGPVTAGILTGTVRLWNSGRSRIDSVDTAPQKLAAAPLPSRT